MPRPRSLEERVKERLTPESEKAAKKKQSAKAYYADFVSQLTPKQREGLMEALYDAMEQDNEREASGEDEEEEE
jgi:hypothetical protein